MSQFSVVSTPTTTYPDTGRAAFGTMKRDIATYFGLDEDSKKEAWIGRIIHDVIDDLNSKKLWRFNLYTSSDITTSSGTSSYSLSSAAPNIWRAYNVRKTDDIDYTLSSLRQSTHDIIFQSQNNITGYPYVHTNFNIYRNGTLELFPTPDGAYTISLRYFQLIGKPSSDSDTLDLPPPYQVVPKYGALARVAAMVGHPTVGYWEGKFQEAYNDMNASDEDIGDESLRFFNIEEMDSRAASFSNPALRPRYADFY